MFDSHGFGLKNNGSDLPCPAQLAVKLVRARMVELEAAIADAKTAGAEVAEAAAEKEISGLEDSLDGEHSTG